ncbi:hypothetical protein ACFWP5_16200 [Streptomyces sp. NPDC058469]|uniref:hypothetical protein n=1 Tax=Streptomyces sp. NPDC058469 TaxID=3346514 RepID=UPI003651D46B
MSEAEYERRYSAEREPSPLSLQQISELFHQLLAAVARPRSKDYDPARNLTERLRAHLGTAPRDRPLVKAAYPPHDLPNGQLALEHWFAGEDRSYELVGAHGTRRPPRGPRRTPLRPRPVDASAARGAWGGGRGRGRGRAGVTPSPSAIAPRPAATPGRG